MDEENLRKPSISLFRFSGGVTGLLGLAILLGPVVPYSYWSIKSLAFLMVINALIALKGGKVAVFYMTITALFLFSFLFRGPYNTGTVPYYFWGKVALGGGSLLILSGCFQAIVQWDKLKWF